MSRLEGVPGEPGSVGVPGLVGESEEPGNVVVLGREPGRVGSVGVERDGLVLGRTVWGALGRTEEPD